MKCSSRKGKEFLFGMKCGELLIGMQESIEIDSLFIFPVGADIVEDLSSIGVEISSIIKSIGELEIDSICALLSFFAIMVALLGRYGTLERSFHLQEHAFVSMLNLQKRWITIEMKVMKP